MSGRPARLLDRPLAERERRRAFAAVALAVLLAAAALSVIAPPHGPHPTAPDVTAPATAVVSSTPRPIALPAPPALVLRAGRLFLSDYLSFLYGHTRAWTFRAASPSLRRSLASHPARVSPAMRRRHPHVVRLTGHRLASRSRWLLTATIADGGAARYPLELLIATSSRGALVVALGED